MPSSVGWAAALVNPPAVLSASNGPGSSSPLHSRTSRFPGSAAIRIQRRCPRPRTLQLPPVREPLRASGHSVIDRVLDMMRTLTNVTGQMLVPVLVAREEGLLDEAVYNRAATQVGLEKDVAEAE